MVARRRHRRWRRFAPVHAYPIAFGDIFGSHDFARRKARGELPQLCSRGYRPLCHACRDTRSRRCRDHGVLIPHRSVCRSARERWCAETVKQLLLLCQLLNKLPAALTCRKMLREACCRHCHQAHQTIGRAIYTHKRLPTLLPKCSLPAHTTALQQRRLSHLLVAPVGVRYTVKLRRKRHHENEFAVQILRPCFAVTGERWRLC